MTHLDLHLRIVGIFRKDVSQVQRRGIVRFDRCYVILEYNSQHMGKLAISESIFDEMYAGGAKLLPKNYRKPR